MQREKQIEEMAKVLRPITMCFNCRSSLNNDGKRDGGCYLPTFHECPHGEFILKYCEALYNAGYRKHTDRFLLKENGEIIPLLPKQSEWISVEERLPKVDTDVLVITANGSFKVGRCNIYHNGTLVLWMTNDGLGEKAITHWMPLPEAPKMKQN